MKRGEGRQKEEEEEKRKSPPFSPELTAASIPHHPYTAALVKIANDCAAMGAQVPIILHLSVGLPASPVTPFIVGSPLEMQLQALAAKLPKMVCQRESRKLS